MRKLIIVILLAILSFPVYPISKELEKQAIGYRQKGYQLQSKGDINAALGYYLKALEIEPYYKEAYNDTGIIYEKRGNLKKAEQMYLKAIEIDDTYLAPYTNLAFLYEKKNDIDKAVYYWKKRYHLGKPGSPWRQKAKEYLVKLGAYPQMKREKMERKAAALARELIYKREQKKLEKQREIKLHYDLGSKALTEGNYNQALKEFKTVLSLNPEDEKLVKNSDKYYKEAKRNILKQKVKAYLENGLNYLKTEDYLSLMQAVKKANELVPKIPLN